MTPLKHRSVAALLVLAVIVAHVFFTDALLTQLAALDPNNRPPDRIDVKFVSEVHLSTPPQAAAPVPPPPAKKPGRPKRMVMPPDEPASAPPPETAASAPELAASVAAAASQAEAPASAASSAVAAASAASSAASASAAKPFEWPASTNISFKLTGQYRGEVQGSAQVDWLLSGTHYQVHVDTYIGPKFAPIFRRSVSSDGEISDHGLIPHRYDEETKVAFASAKHKYVLFDGDEIELSEGKKREPRLPEVQDAASQFVQFTYMFTVNPNLLATGNVLVMPLALPRKQEPIIYDVVGTDTLNTPMGLLPAIHVKPRVPPRPGKPDLTVELWFAPNLEYLPVRMRIWQDDQTYIDMVIDRPPLRGETKLQALPAGARTPTGDVVNPTVDAPATAPAPNAASSN